MTVPRAEDDEGTVMLLTIGMTAVLLLLVALVVDVSAVILTKRGLSSVADGAAVAAAQQVDAGAVRSGGLGSGRVPLDDQSVADAVQTYGDGQRADEPGLVLTSRVDGDDTAVVDVARQVHLPFVGWLGVRAVTVRAESRAQSPVVP